MLVNVVLNDWFCVLCVHGGLKSVGTKKGSRDKIVILSKIESKGLNCNSN